MARNHSFLSQSIVKVTRIYQTLISPLLGPRCRFHPSCSEYLTEAVITLGWQKGLWLTLLRLLKCHPFHPGGYDPVIKVKKT